MGTPFQKTLHAQQVEPIAQLKYAQQVGLVAHLKWKKIFSFTHTPVGVRIRTVTEGRNPQISPGPS